MLIINIFWYIIYSSKGGIGLTNQRKSYLSEIGKRIKDLRTELNMTQEELASKCGYKSRSTINKIELGINDIPQSKIVLFADALGVSVSNLMNWDEVKKKNDNLTDIVLRLRKDEDFAELVNSLIKLNQVQLTSIKQIIAAFLEKSWYFSGEVGKWNQEVPHQQKAVILRFFQYNPFASQPLPFLIRQRYKLSIALVGANYMIKKFLKQHPNLIFEESNFYKKISNKK